MTVTEQACGWAYFGDGVTDTFQYTNLIFKAEELRVFVDGALVSTGYTVTGVGVKTGGNVVFITPPPIGADPDVENVVIVSSIPATQPTSWQQITDLPSKLLEQSSDHDVRILQQLLFQLGRTLRQADGDPAVLGTIPPVADLLNMLIGIDGSGNPVGVAQTGLIATSLAGNATNFPRVNASETGYDFRTPAQTRADIGADNASNLASGTVADTRLPTTMDGKTLTNATLAAPVLNAATGTTMSLSSAVQSDIYFFGGAAHAAYNGSLFRGQTTRAASSGFNLLELLTAAGATQTFAIKGDGSVGVGSWAATKIGLAFGGTNADLSATGGTSRVLKQTSAGAAITVAQLAASDLSNGTSGTGAVALIASPAFTGAPSFAGSGSGTTAVQAAAAASGTLTLPAATDTLMGKATTDVMTGKTFDTAGSGNVFKINGTQISDKSGTGKMLLDTSPVFNAGTVDMSTSSVLLGGSSQLSGTTGQLRLGASTIVNASMYSASYNAGVKGGLGLLDTSSSGSGAAYASFQIGTNTVIGTILNVTNTGVAFNTTSDERLKNFGSALDASAAFDNIRVRRLNWKSNGSPGVGFSAQEVALWAPEAVSVGNADQSLGPSDAGFRAWQIDHSKLVPYLWAAVAALRTQVNSLAAAA